MSLLSRRIVIAMGLAVIGSLYSVPEAKALVGRPNTFRVVGVANKTNIKLNYQLRVGARSSMRPYQVNSGGYRWHWTTGSASPRIRFDFDLTSASRYKTYYLPYNTVRTYLRSPTWSQARKYKFVRRGNILNLYRY